MGEERDTICPMALDEILLLTNGPGELSTWVPPVLRRLRERVPEARIELFLIRDQFATGTEETKARQLPLDAISGRTEFLARLARRKGAGRGVVLMLGGAPRDAVLLGRATGYPAYAYSFNGRAWQRGLKAYLLDSERSVQQALARGARPEQVQAVGNLVVDALEDALRSGVNWPQADVLLFPSSRPFAVKYMLGFMLAAAEHIAAAQPHLRFAWVKSRLLTRRSIEEGLSARLVREFGGVGGSLQGDRVVSEGGLEVAVLDEELRYGAMRQAKLALTIPGTSTLEMGFLGLPAVVLLPLHKPEAIPVPIEGLLHWIGLLPGGKWLRHEIVRRLEARIPHLALPNQYLGERLYPELRGIFSPQDVARTALEVLRPDVQSRIRQRLRELEARPGADALVEVVLSVIGQPSALGEKR
ncbi:Lipid-A-disaccharide synthase [Calidithermus roseus]|uniref:Lipid-A-disaccharide synthase n=2 Tax=Calidithermus roseus TaxID=1644118 RepID=A0A399EJ23_9DEIN|nr:Lipid-A-disaccharide synthase [Calidithermus roseus]